MSLKSLIPTPLKRYLLSPIKHRVDAAVTSFQLAVFAVMRAVRKAKRTKLAKLAQNPIRLKRRAFEAIDLQNTLENTSFSSSYPNSYNFVILCIKKTGYADLAITNVNSLHYRNPTHHVTIQCDPITHAYLTKRFSRFDYPTQVALELIPNSEDSLSRGWQFFKVEAIIAAAQHDRILFDADTFWHEDITVDRDKITMLANCKTMGDDVKSKGVINHVFNKPEWLGFQHNVAAFASIPKKLMTDKIASDMREFNQMIQNHSLDFVTNEHDRTEIRRLSEEYAVNLSIQNNYPQDMLVVLKSEDGVKNRNKMESLYFGSRNRIIE